jgi:hypothetical protein
MLCFVILHLDVADGFWIRILSEDPADGGRRKLILMPDGEAMAEVSSLFLARLDGHRRCSFRRVSVEGWEKQRIHMLPKSRTCMSVSRETGFVWPSPPPAQKACGALYVSCLTAYELVMFTIAVVSFHQPEGTRELAVLYPPRFCVFRALINVQANAGVCRRSHPVTYT